MLRDILFSSIGHAAVFGCVFFPSFMVAKTQPPVTIVMVNTVSPQAIEQLLSKTAPTPQAKPKPKIPQVNLEPDKVLPQKTHRPKQALKTEISQPNDNKADESKKGDTNNTEFAGIKLDNEFDYPEYLIDMQQRIQRNWRPPTIRASLSTRVYFKIGKDGTIIRALVEIQTGDIQFDTSAMTAVTQSGPFPPLPEGYELNDLGVHFDFIYNL